MKLYIVTYAVSSADNYENQAYTEAHVYDTKEAARAKVRLYRDNEIQNCEESENGYTILYDSPDYFHITWGDGDEVVKVTIHEVELNK